MRSQHPPLAAVAVPTAQTRSPQGPSAAATPARALPAEHGPWLGLGFALCLLAAAAGHLGAPDWLASVGSLLLVSAVVAAARGREIVRAPAGAAVRVLPAVGVVLLAGWLLLWVRASGLVSPGAMSGLLAGLGSSLGWLLVAPAMPGRLVQRTRAPAWDGVPAVDLARAD